MVRSILIAGLLGAVLGLVGCSSDKLSEKDIEKLVHGSILGGICPTTCLVENFRINKEYEQGDKTHIVDVEYDLYFPGGPAAIGKEFIKKPGVDKDPMLHMYVAAIAAAIAMKYGNVQVGDRVPVQEQVTLVNTDKGWKVKPKKVKGFPQLGAAG